MEKIKYNAAFTLVELSIVIVVISLIIAGVTAGRSLVSSARLNAQIQDLQVYSTAYNAFVMQYNAVPGDMSNANTYWGTATNGDGNGRLNSHSDAGDPTSTTSELYTLFQHLSLAKLIPGYYNNTYTLGVGYPRLKLDPSKGMSGTYGINIPGPSSYQLSNSTDFVSYKAVLAMNISRPSISDNGFNDALGVMSPRQASFIDTKIDDGLPTKGRFNAYVSYSASSYCLTGIDGSYLTTDYPVCMAQYVLR